MEHGLEFKPSVFIPFSLLPEGKFWQVGKSYRAKVVLRQTSTSENGADFELVDATSLEPKNTHKDSYNE